MSFEVVMSSWDRKIYYNDMLIAGYDIVARSGFIHKKRYSGFYYKQKYDSIIIWYEDVNKLLGENMFPTL